MVEEKDFLFLISSQEYPRKFEDIFREGKVYSFNQIKEKYANYLDKIYPNEREFPAIDGLDGCDINDVLGQIKQELGIRFIGDKEYQKNTKSVKADIDEFFIFVEDNRDKDYKWFENCLTNESKLEGFEEPEYLDLYIDSKALVLSTLCFKKSGSILESITNINENDLFDDYIDVDGISYNHKDVEEFFNQKVVKFNDMQTAINLTRDVIDCPVSKRAEILSAVHKYMNDKYGAGCDMSYKELGEELVTNKGIVDLAYTELGDKNQFPVQVGYDLNSNRYLYEMGGFDVSDLAQNFQSTFETLNLCIDDFIRDMNFCDFDDMIRIHYDILEKLYGSEWETADLDSIDIPAEIEKAKMEYRGSNKKEQLVKEAKDLADQGSKTDKSRGVIPER